MEVFMFNEDILYSFTKIAARNLRKFYAVENHQNDTTIYMDWGGCEM